jgi:hypothetical protein
MRARSTHDKDGNSYRYQRAIKKDEEEREKRARIEKWDRIYDQACSSSKKQS